MLSRESRGTELAKVIGGTNILEEAEVRWIVSVRVTIPAIFPRQPPIAGSMSAIAILAPTIGLNEDQLLCCVLAGGSSRRQIDNPGAPSASIPTVGGLGVWVLMLAGTG